MPPRRARLDPWLERRRHDEGGEITGDECRRRRTRSFFDAAVGRACKPINDKRGTIEYRVKVAGVLARRAAAIAFERAAKR